jgi:hypothetical protein
VELIEEANAHRVPGDGREEPGGLSQVLGGGGLRRTPSLMTTRFWRTLPETVVETTSSCAAPLPTAECYTVLPGTRARTLAPLRPLSCL